MSTNKERSNTQNKMCIYLPISIVLQSIFSEIGHLDIGKVYQSPVPYQMHYTSNGSKIRRI